MDTNFEHYKVFYYVAKYGNLTKAAAVLKTSQPAVTRTIHNLENILIGGNRFEKLKNRELSLGELSTCPWISLTAKAITRKFLDSYFEQHGLQFSPDVELATTDMILPAVRYNLGIGFIPREFAQDDLESGKVFEIQVKEALPERNILFVVHLLD